MDWKAIQIIIFHFVIALVFIAGLKEEAINLYWGDKPDLRSRNIVERFIRRIKKFFIWILAGNKRDILRQCNGKPKVNWCLLWAIILSSVLNIYLSFRKN